MLPNDVHATRAPGDKVGLVAVCFGKLGNEVIEALLVLWSNIGSRDIVRCVDLSDGFRLGDELLRGAHGGVSIQLSSSRSKKRVKQSRLSDQNEKTETRRKKKQSSRWWSEEEFSEIKIRSATSFIIWRGQNTGMDPGRCPLSATRESRMLRRSHALSGISSAVVSVLLGGEYKALVIDSVGPIDG